MESEINQFGFSEGAIDSSYAVSSNDFKVLSDEIEGSLNAASDTLLGAVEPLRSCTETEPLLAPLDDILKDIYDIKSSLASSPNMTYPMVSSSSHTMLPTFTSPINNMCYGNYMNSETSYDIPSSSYAMNYLSNSSNNFMPSSAMQMPMMANPIMDNVCEENDSGPVYLNFNIDSMASASIPGFSKVPQQVHQNTTGFEKLNNLDRNLKYMEYVNEIGEAAKTRYVDNNATDICDKASRHNSIKMLNLIKPPENRTKEIESNDEGCSKYLYTNNDLMNTVENNAKTVTEVIYQNNCHLIKQNCYDSIIPINSNIEWTNVMLKPQKGLVPEVVICRPPLQTKRTIQENPTISIDFVTDNSANSTLELNYVAVLDNSDVEIPTIINRPKTDRKRRKQELKIRDWEDSVFFEQLKTMKSGDDCNSQEKSKTSPSCRTPGSSTKDGQYDHMFLGKRKKKNYTSPNIAVNWIGDDPDYKPFTGSLLPGRRKSKINTPTRDSYKTRTSERVKKINDNDSVHGSSNEIPATSDSDLEDLATLASKSLKCSKCKKIFKTPRSLAIHQKRCTVQIETESDLEITMVEYLESEKEFDDTDEISFVDTGTGTGTTTVTLIEKIECDEEKSEEPIAAKAEVELPEMSKVVEIEENPLRRNTRSQTNLNASKKIGQTNEKCNETKQSNNQIKSKTTKATTSNVRNSRRKRNK